MTKELDELEAKIALLSQERLEQESKELDSSITEKVELLKLQYSEWRDELNYHLREDYYPCCTKVIRTFNSAVMTEINGLGYSLMKKSNRLDRKKEILKEVEGKEIRYYELKHNYDKNNFVYPNSSDEPFFTKDFNHEFKIHVLPHYPILDRKKNPHLNNRAYNLEEKTMRTLGVVEKGLMVLVGLLALSIPVLITAKNKGYNFSCGCNISGTQNEEYYHENMVEEGFEDEKINGYLKND